MTGLKFLGVGAHVPERIVTNADFERRIETSDEWIRTRTGIAQRHHCTGEGNTDLALAAARRAIERAGIDRREITCVIVATFTPDHCCPVTACLLQSGLELSTDVIAFDLNGGCTGFLFALETAYGLLHKRGGCALVVGSEVISRAVNYDDRGTCVLFGDGAGAVVVSHTHTSSYYSVCGAEGNLDYLHVHGPAEPRVYIEMDGKAVFRFATGIIPRCIDDLLAQSGLTLDEVDWFVLHQANKRVIDHVARRMGIPDSKVFCNIERYGNTSAASIPLALDEMARGGLLRRGQKVICVGFGGGLTWGGCLTEW